MANITLCGVIFGALELINILWTDHLKELRTRVKVILVEIDANLRGSHKFDGFNTSASV